jgi:Ca-activated chloride channel family protein
MHLHSALLLVAIPVVALALPGAPSQLRDPNAFKSGIDVTGVTVTVRDADGKLVTGLTRDDFEVFEDGDPQAITQFTRERVPVSVGVLLDMSDSMFGRPMEDAREAVNGFLFEQLDAQDEFFILAFNHRPHVMTTWTHTADVVRQALDSLKPTGGTAVYDATLEALPLIARRNRERGALLIVSDGADTASTAGLKEVRFGMRRSQAFVYAIAIDTPTRAINRSVNPSTLREITDESGGRTEVVQGSAEIAAASARIADELNHQYVLGYTPPHGADGKFHSIRVRARGAEYRVRARKGYVAEPGVLTTPRR